MKKIFLLVAIVGLIGVTSFAGEPGKTAMAFLKLGQGARANGMGEAFVGLADDINALYWNPAGLSQIEDREAGFMFLKPYDEIDGLGYGYLSSVFPTNKAIFATSISYFDYGKEKKYEVDNNNPVDKREEWTACDMSFSFGLGGKMPNENIALGLSLKAIYGKIDNSDAYGFCADAGMLYKPSIAGMKIGAVVKNIGTRIKFEKESDPLPLSLKLGLSYLLPKTLAPITITLDGTIPNDNNPYINIGGEYDYRKALAIRLGFKSGPQDEGSGLTAGFGIKQGRFSLDFAFQPSGELGNSYFVSLASKY
ncbi:MAG: PorV/PorQ family protein [bacterium]